MDCRLAFVVAVIQVGGGRMANLRQTGVQSLDVLGYLLLIAGPVALVLRRYQPVAVFVVTMAICVAYLVRGYGYGPIFVSLVVAFLTAATTRSRWWTYPLVPVGYFALVWPLPALLGRPTNEWQVLGLAAWLAVLVSVAEGIRQRQAVLVARRQRAEAARRDEQAQRQRAASEERLAIARELHDVLAHSLSLINVQSSVALELFDKKPEQARSALAAIKAASKESLAEVHILLQSIRTGNPVAGGEFADNEPGSAREALGDTHPGRPGVDRDSSTLRSESTGPQRASGEPANGSDPTDRPEAAAGPRAQPAPRMPAPSIANLDTLLQRIRAAGLRVTTRVLGTTRQLPSVIDVAAARIIQESLTNVARHAPGADATVTVRYTGDSVDITVDNTRPTGTPSRSDSTGGNGIMGMRERAHAFGGALTAGPRPSGGFRVAARLPSQESPATPPGQSKARQPESRSAPAQLETRLAHSPDAPNEATQVERPGPTASGFVDHNEPMALEKPVEQNEPTRHPSQPSGPTVQGAR